MTLTTPNVDTDIDTILQDAAPEPPCRINECTAKADWLIVFTCGHDQFACNTHRETVRHVSEDLGAPIRCSASGHEAQLVVAVVRWIAL